MLSIVWLLLCVTKTQRGLTAAWPYFIVVVIALLGGRIATGFAVELVANCLQHYYESVVFIVVAVIVWCVVAVGLGDTCAPLWRIDGGKGAPVVCLLVALLPLGVAAVIFFASLLAPIIVFSSLVRYEVVFAGGSPKQ